VEELYIYLPVPLAVSDFSSSGIPIGRVTSNVEHGVDTETTSSHLSSVDEDFLEKKKKRGGVRL
jgi:hypothetical protein